MAYGQVDPASLEGEALMRWYRRTPQEIEDERRRAAADAYNRFFYPTRTSSADVDLNDQTPQSGDGQNPSTIPDWQTASWAQPNPSSAPASSKEGRLQLAAASSPGFWDYWGVPGCANCHGYKPNTLPPYRGHFPFPPNVMPRSGNPGGGSSSPQPRDQYPQCEMQERKDRGICAQQPTPQAQAVCNQSATARRVWCDTHEGELGEPDLFTARRKSGRRWP